MGCSFLMDFTYLLGGKELELFFRGCSPLVWLTCTCLSIFVSELLHVLLICSGACTCFSFCSSAFCTLASPVMPRGFHSAVLMPSSFWLLWEAVTGKGLCSPVLSLQCVLWAVHGWSVCTVIKMFRCFCCLPLVSLFWSWASGDLPLLPSGF